MASREANVTQRAERSGPILQTVELGAQWPTIDPFLFVAHHHDDYPKGNGRLGPDAPLSGRNIGQDFSGNDGWSMYHGDEVPGFPRHPHRGFETITYVRRGLIDHADSLGATARFGRGDSQWMTAGAGIQHAEMFPLTQNNKANPLELFQIWLNLPAADKMVPPYFTMLWNEQTPRVTPAAGVEVTVIAGRLGDAEPQSPPPHSWASNPDADLAIWHIRLDPGASWTMPAAQRSDTQRVLYAFEGSTLAVAGTEVDAGTGVLLQADIGVELVAGPGGMECLLMQGRPIGEPVARHGPFVMNTEDQIHEAYADYEATRFGGWPWSSPSPNHGADADRFAIHADGRREQLAVT
ncbi:MAG: redox-sensitive bicupin YhaK (pirin superfamily) [Candidatus Aldehydirespiratoraceae bacterium]|jgi:redox-sensitive bicupin YhaK (pirin superfamily)